MQEEIKSTWLIQRLNRPWQVDAFKGKDNPFSFGGGMKNGGLSDEAMGLLRDIFEFDYMGAAEFEFGEVPKALHRIANAHDLIADSVLVTGKRELYRPTHRAIKLPEKVAYILAPARFLEHARDVVRRQAASEYPREPRLKEVTLFQNALWAREIADEEHPGTRKKEREERERAIERRQRMAGWLELDNGFFFFTDREMWEKTCALFGVKMPSDAAAE